MNKNINYWTISQNSDYNLIDAFKELKCIEQEQKLNNVKVNDIVYIYVGEPYSQIMFKCKINKVNLSKPSIDDRNFMKDPSEYEKCKRCMEIELLEDYSNNKLFKRKNLENHGLAYNNTRGQSSASETLVNYIEKYKNDDFINKKRVQNKDTWLKILNNEKAENNIVIDILRYLYDCKNYTSSEKQIAEYFNTEPKTINSYIKDFGKRIINLTGLEEQIDNDGSKRTWNIPFETVSERNNNNTFTWKLRQELIDALTEKYNLIADNEDFIDNKIKNFLKEYPYNKFKEAEKKDLNDRNEFVKKFPLNKIKSMKLDDFVAGKAKIDKNGRNSFCYLMENKMTNIGELRGPNIDKFGVWYSKSTHNYKFTKKYGATLEEAFKNLKEEIYSLLINAKNEEDEKISKCKISNIFKGKILSTYYPEKYFCIYNEEDVNKFLNALDIKYDMQVDYNLDKKNKLLKKFKNENKYLKDFSDYYFVLFLYKTFKNELKFKNTVSGEIDYNLEFVDFEYLKKHESKKKNNYRSRNTDYEKINRNKKDVGKRGENAVLQYEINKLKKLGFNNLIKDVIICDNDAIGYDIISFDENKNKMHIEVKTNSSNNSYLDFYITDNELQHLINEDNYYIYYLFDIKENPKCHIINKEKILENNKDFFQPVIYKVNIDILEKK
jgi:hypothetical protein